MIYFVSSAVKIRDSRTVTQEKAYWLLPSGLKTVTYDTVENFQLKIHCCFAARKMTDGDSTDTAHMQTVPQTPALVSNELFCFVANKMDTVPTDTIVLLCAGQYDNGVIEMGKRCSIYAMVGTQRNGNRMKVHNLEDIVKRLPEYNSTADTPRPCFVASNRADLDR